MITFLKDGYSFVCWNCKIIVFNLMGVHLSFFAKTQLLLETHSKVPMLQLDDPTLYIEY
jgi:hypothetical protein